MQLQWQNKTAASALILIEQIGIHFSKNPSLHKTVLRTSYKQKWNSPSIQVCPASFQSTSFSYNSHTHLFLLHLCHTSRRKWTPVKLAHHCQPGGTQEGTVPLELGHVQSLQKHCDIMQATLWLSSESPWGHWEMKRSLCLYHLHFMKYNKYMTRYSHFSQQSLIFYASFSYKPLWYSLLKKPSDFVT